MASQIQALELKNQKLVLELAHLKRIRFGTKSEVLSVEQKQLFEDDADQDLAAIAAELDEAPASDDAPVSRLKARPRLTQPTRTTIAARLVVETAPEYR
jgi:transposase